MWTEVKANSPSAASVRCVRPMRRAAFRPVRRRSSRCTVPPVVWLGLFLVAPLLLMAAFSFRPDLRGGLLDAFAPTLKHYAAIIGTESYLRLLAISALMAFAVATVAIALAYPIAYYLARHAGPRAGLYVLLLLVPFWTSYLLRVMAWKLMLGQEGVDELLADVSRMDLGTDRRPPLQPRRRRS